VTFVSMALYRTYRPAKLDDVVGQDHVTGPLRRALENDRVHHALPFLPAPAAVARPPRRASWPAP